MKKERSMIFICDDVRHEEGGKVSLMGIYNDDILINKTNLPFHFLKLCLVLVTENINKKVKNLTVKVNLPDPKASITGTIEILRGKSKANYIMVLPSFIVKGETKLEIEVVFNGTDEVIKKEVPIRINDKESQ